MERAAMKALIHWKEKKKRKPLLITGCRQCGKTWLMTEFGKRCFERTALFNFEKEPALADIFRYDLNPERILRELGMYLDGKPIDTERTLMTGDIVRVRVTGASEYDLIGELAEEEEEDEFL